MPRYSRWHRRWSLLNLGIEAVVGVLPGSEAESWVVSCSPNQLSTGTAYSARGSNGGNAGLANEVEVVGNRQGLVTDPLWRSNTSIKRLIVSISEGLISLNEIGRWKCAFLVSHKEAR